MAEFIDSVEKVVSMEREMTALNNDLRVWMHVQLCGSCMAELVDSAWLRGGGNTPFQCWMLRGVGALTCVHDAV